MKLPDTSTLVPVDDVIVLEFVERPINKVADDRDTQSIRAGGIQQPSVMVRHEDKLYLADGLRRLRIARHLEIPKVPAIVLPLPADRELHEYVRELRLVLDMQKQDLAPSQKAELVETLKRNFNMTHRQVAAYLGIAPDSVTNWLSVRHYIAPVVKALDAGQLTAQAARVFDGLTEAGQKTIWKSHGDELMQSSGGELHKVLRRQYSPESHPEFYRDPELISSRLGRKGGARKARSRTPITSSEKRRLMQSLEMRETEMRVSTEELRELTAEINASIPICAAILRNEKLLALVPEEMREELHRFGEIYC